MPERRGFAKQLYLGFGRGATSIGVLPKANNPLRLRASAVNSCSSRYVKPLNLSGQIVQIPLKALNPPLSLSGGPSETAIHCGERF